MPPEQVNGPAPTQPEMVKSVAFWERKMVWISLAVFILLGAGGYYMVQQQTLLQTASDNFDSGQTLPTNNTQQQQRSNTSVQAPTNNPQPPSNSPSNTAQQTTVAASANFALIPARRQSVVISGNNIFDPEYGLGIPYPTGWSAVSSNTYTNTDVRTIYLQRNDIKLTISPSVFWYSSVADAHKKDESVLKQKTLVDGTLFMVGRDDENAFFARIFWGYQYPDGSWQIVTDILQITGFSEAYIEQLKQKNIPVTGYLSKQEAKTIADNIFASVTIDPRKVRDFGRITELVRIASTLDLQQEYHGGVPLTSTMPQTVSAASGSSFPTHNCNGTSQGAPYGWVDNSKPGQSGYCLYTRLESGASAGYYMISDEIRSKERYSMSRGSYVTRPPKDMKECNFL